MLRFRFVTALAGAALLGVSRASAQTSLTIYNDGRVLVRRTVPVHIPRGSSTLPVPLGALDPASVFSLDSAVVIQRAVYDAAVDEASVLRRAVGQKILFRSGLRAVGGGVQVPDTMSAVVLSVDPLQFQLPDGRITFSMPGTALYPADLVMSAPTARLTLQSEAARETLRVGYFTDGAQWRASYQVILGATTARVTGAAVITSQSLKADSAEIQLLAGSVSTAQVPSPSVMRDEVATKRMAMSAVSAPVGEQRVGEFHLYSIPEKLTLLPGMTSSAALFDPATASYERNYVVRGQIPYYGYLPQQPNEDDVPVEVSYTLKRPRKTAFGDRPLPGGVARIFQADSGGRLQLVGEAGMDHTPAGEDLRLSAGTAFDLTAKRIQTNYSTRRDSLAGGGWRTIATADYRVTVSNATDSVATVDVLEQRAGAWTIVTSSVKPEKVSSTITRFRVTVPARGEAVVTYRVRVTW